MKTISFNEFFNIMLEHRQGITLDRKSDMVFMICGDEGSGKSMFSLALGAIDPNFYSNYLEHKDQIYFQWDKFLEANKIVTQITSKTLRSDLQKEVLKMVAEKYKLKEEDFNPSKPTRLGPGSVLMYDEAGTQMFNRSSMTKGNIDQVKLFISNRSNRLIYFMNVPKPRNLDVYPREERTRYFIFIRHNNILDKEREERIAYIWGREAYKRLMGVEYWWSNLTRNFGYICKEGGPDYRIKIPRLDENNYRLESDNGFKGIPLEVLKHYEYEKACFQLKQAIEMEESKLLNNKKDNHEVILKDDDYQKYCLRAVKNGKKAYSGSYFRAKKRELNVNDDYA